MTIQGRRKHLENGTACHLWKKRSWREPISQSKESNKREACLIFWYNGLQKIDLSLSPCKIQIMQLLSSTEQIVH